MPADPNAITWPLEEKAVLWTKTGKDTYAQTTYGTPEEIDCRWEDAVQEITMPDGIKVVVKTQVMVDRPINNGDVLWYGLLVNVPNPASPFSNPGAYAVMMFERTPDIDAEEFLYCAYL